MSAVTVGPDLVLGQVSPDPAVSDLDVAYALTGVDKKWRYRYDLVLDNGQVIGSPNVESCTVKNADLADTQRTIDASIRDMRDINYATDRLRPSVGLWVKSAGRWVDWPMGVFLLSSPQQSRLLREGAQQRDVVGYDRGLTLRDDKVLDRFIAPKGALYTDVVVQVLASTGLPTTGVSGSDGVLPAAMEWGPGTAKATIINELLAAVNFRSLWFNGQGLPVAQEYETPADAAPVFRYEADQRSVLRPEVREDFDLQGIPNVFVLTVSSPDREELRSVYTNDSEDSPTSTVNIGRRIVEFREETDAADQATLDALAKRAATEASQVFSTIQFSTAAMPFHGAGDVVLVDGGAGLTRYRETEWTLPLTPGGEMTHTARRVVAV